MLFAMVMNYRYLQLINAVKLISYQCIFFYLLIHPEYHTPHKSSSPYSHKLPRPKINRVGQQSHTTYDIRAQLRHRTTLSPSQKKKKKKKKKKKQHNELRGPVNDPRHKSPFRRHRVLTNLATSVHTMRSSSGEGLKKEGSSYPTETGQ